jgi:hypothetical protein
MKLYCWPKAGSTIPAGIEALLNMGVDVHFVDNLHAKVFWSSGAGAVIGSANLSANGMDDNRLIEAAVQVPPGDPELAAFLASVHACAIGSSSAPRQFKAQMERLRVADVQYRQRNPVSARAPGAPRRPVTPSFGEWCRSKAPERWQLGWWKDAESKPPRDAAAAFARRHPGEQYSTWLSGVSGDIVEAVATLDVKLAPNPWQAIFSPRPYWWYPEEVVVSEQKNAAKDPYNWFARIDVPTGRGVPFNATEKRFQDALANTVSIFGDDMLGVRGTVKGRFLKELKHHYGIV